MALAVTVEVVVKTIILPVENRFLRRIFEPKRDENGEWRRLHNEEPFTQYSEVD